MLKNICLQLKMLLSFPSQTVSLFWEGINMKDRVLEIVIKKEIK
jgi:hypothetical protein